MLVESTLIISQIFSLRVDLDHTHSEADPFSMLIASKQLGQQFIALIKAFAELQGFPADAREAAILTIGVVYQAAYELHAHTVPL